MDIRLPTESWCLILFDSPGEWSETRSGEILRCLSLLVEVSEYQKKRESPVLMLKVIIFDEFNYILLNYYGHILLIEVPSFIFPRKIGISFAGWIATIEADLVDPSLLPGPPLKWSPESSPLQGSRAPRPCHTTYPMGIIVELSKLYKKDGLASCSITCKIFDHDDHGYNEKFI